MKRIKRTLILFFLTFFACVAKAVDNRDIKLMANGLSMEINIRPNQSASLASLYQWHFPRNGSYMLTFSKPKDIKDADGFSVSLKIQLPNTRCDHWYEKDALRFTWEDCHIPEPGIAGTSEEGHDAVYMQYPAGGDSLEPSRHTFAPGEVYAFEKTKINH